MTSTYRASWVRVATCWICLEVMWSSRTAVFWIPPGLLSESAPSHSDEWCQTARKKIVIINNLLYQVKANQIDVISWCLFRNLRNLKRYNFVKFAIHWQRNIYLDNFDILFSRNLSSRKWTFISTILQCPNKFKRKFIQEIDDWDKDAFWNAEGFNFTAKSNIKLEALAQGRHKENATLQDQRTEALLNLHVTIVRW